MDVRKGENMEEKVSGLGRSDILKAGRGASIKLAGDTQLISYDGFHHVGLSVYSKVSSVTVCFWSVM